MRSGALWLLLGGGLVASVGYANPAGTSEEADHEQARRGVMCVNAGDMACGIELLEPLKDSTDDSPEQGSIRLALAMAYEQSERALKAVDMYLAFLSTPDMPATHRRLGEDALDALLDPSSTQVDVGDHRTIDALREMGWRRKPAPRWQARMDYILALALADDRQYDAAVEVFERLAGNTAAGKRLAQRAAKQAEALKAQHPARLRVPCRGGREVYFAVQPLGGGGAPDAAPPRRCSPDPVEVEPGRYTVVVWQRGQDGVDGGTVPHQQAITARRTAPVELDYLLAPPPPPVERFSMTGVAVGGGLVAVGLISNVIAAAADGEAAVAETAAALGYGSGLALLVGEAIRFGLDSRADSSPTVQAPPFEPGEPAEARDRGPRRD